VNTLYCFEEWKGEQIISPTGDNFTPRGQNSPLGDNFTPGSKFAPRCEVKNGPLEIRWINFYSDGIRQDVYASMTYQ
jgi:hypothetical protein